MQGYVARPAYQQGITLRCLPAFTDGDNVMDFENRLMPAPTHRALPTHLAPSVPFKKPLFQRLFECILLTSCHKNSFALLRLLGPSISHPTFFN